MNEEAQKIIDELTAAGATDEEIAEVLEQMSASAPAQPPPTAPEQPEQSLFNKAGEYVGLLNRGIVEPLVSGPMKLYGAVENKFGELIGTGPGLVYGAGQAAEDLIRDLNPISRETEESFVGQAVLGLGTGIGLIASAGFGLAGQAAKVGEAATVLKTLGKTLTGRPAIVGGAMTAVPEYEAALASGKDDEAFEVLMKNYLVGQTETIPVTRWLGRLNKLTGGGLAKRLAFIGKSGAIGGVEEALQEGVQTYLSNEIAKDTYDPERDPAWALLNAMAVGGIVGIVLPGVAAAVTSAPKKSQAKLAQKLSHIERLAAMHKAVDTALGGVASPDAAPAITDIDATANQVIADTATEPNATAIAAKKLENIKVQLDADNIAKAAGEPATLSPEERQAAEDQQNILQGKPTDAEKEAEKEANKKKEGAKENKKTTDANDAENVEENVVEEPPSPAYLKALDEVTKLQQMFIEQATADPGAYLTEQYNQLAAASHALAQIAPATKKGKTTATQQRIEDATGVTKQGKEEPMTVGQAIRLAWKKRARATTQGVRKGAALKNDLITKVQEAIKNFNLTPRQISVLMTKIKNTNLFTAGSVSRLSTLVDKIASDSVFADKLARANELRSKIRKKRNTRKDWREKDALKLFSRVDPDEVDVDAYLSQAEEIYETFASPLNRKVINIAGTEEYVGSVPDTGAIKAHDRIESMADDLGLTFEEAQILLQEKTPAEEATANAAKAASIRENLVETAEEAKNLLFDAWDEGEIVADHEYNKTDVAALKKIDLKLLTNQQIKDFIKLVDGIHVNENFGGAGRFTAIAQAQQDFAELEKVAKGWSILSLTTVEANFDSLPQTMQAILGLPQDAALFQLYMGFKGVNDASIAALDAETKFVEGVNKLKAKFKEAFTNDSVLRQGIYGELIRHNEGTDPEAALAQNKEVISETIQSYKEIGEVEEMKRVAELYAPFATALSMEDVTAIMNKIDPGGKAVIDYAIEAFLPYGDEIVAYNDRFFNKKTTKVNNYSGPRVWRKKGTGLEETEDFGAMNPDAQASPFTNLANAPKQISSAKEFTGVDRTDSVLDFNKHYNMTKGVKTTVFGLKAMMPMLQVRENLKRGAKPGQDVLKLFGAREDDPKSIVKARGLYDKIFNRKDGAYFDFEDHVANRKIPKKLDRQFSNFLNPLRKLGYIFALSGISQIPKQATVLANVAINLFENVGLMNFREVLLQKKELNEFFVGETLSKRGVQISEYSLGELTGPQKSQETQSAISSFINKNFEGWLGIKPLVKTDVAVAKISYMAFYREYLLKQGVKDEGLVKENELRNDKVRQEARAYAKQRVDTLQVVSNPSELGARLKDQSVGWQVAKALLIPFGTFSSNTKSRMFADWRAMATGNATQRNAAAKDLFATAVEQTTFHSVSGAMKIYLWSSLGQMVAGLFDLPEEKDRDKRDWESVVKVWKTNMFFDTLPIVLTDPGEKTLVALINQAAVRLFNYKNPLYKYAGNDANPMNTLSEIAGPYGIMLERYWQFGKVVSEASAGERKVGSNYKTLTPQQSNFTWMVALMYALNVSGKLPSDVIFAIDRERRLQKPGKRRYKEVPVEILE